VGAGAAAARVDLSLVVPCYNESDNAANVRARLLPVMAELAARGSVEVVFVNDGSSDDTQAAFEALTPDFVEAGIAARVVPHDRNRGLGAALRTGFAASRGDVVVTTDVDATYRFEEIPALLARLEHADLVTASPYHPAGAIKDVPRHRLVLSKGSSLIYRLIVTPRLYTYTCLFRAYRREVLDRVPFESDGFLAGTEILVNAVMAGYRAAEHPAVLHSRVHGVSKAKLARTIRAHLAFQARVLGARLHMVRAPWHGVEPGHAPSTNPFLQPVPMPRAPRPVPAGKAE
jgi:dolichol-phosphate mannosyltransferase